MLIARPPARGIGMLCKERLFGISAGMNDQLRPTISWHNTRVTISDTMTGLNRSSTDACIAIFLAGKVLLTGLIPL